MPPHHYGTTFQMPHAQLHEWMNAESVHDRVYFGGPFAPPTPESLSAFSRELMHNAKLRNVTFPKMS